MDYLQIFKQDKFGTIRTFVFGTNPWFSGEDVANALGYKNPSKAVEDFVDDEDLVGVAILDDTEELQEMPVVNIVGFHYLVRNSHSPESKNFKRWVLSEVVPQAIKYQELNDKLCEAAEKIEGLIGECEDERRQKIALQQENAELLHQISFLRKGLNSLQERLAGFSSDDHSDIEED